MAIVSEKSKAADLVEKLIPEHLKGLHEAAKLAMKDLDNDPLREGIANTPLRWAKAMYEMTHSEPFEMTTFEGDGYDQMVVQANIKFYSLCEHHWLPFFGTATVAYIPKKRIVGISKLPRTVKHFSRLLQVQERMTTQIAELLQDRLQPKGVGVVLRARHMCQEMRGIEASGAETVTSCLKGEFMSDAKVRSEFLSLAGVA